jgi:hypothetical protein
MDDLSALLWHCTNGFVKLLRSKGYTVRVAYSQLINWDKVIGVAVATSGTDVYAEFLKYFKALSSGVRCD